MLNKPNTTDLSTNPIGSLILRQALPSIAGLVLQTTYSLADAFFVSHWIGDYAVAALAIVFPIQLILMASAQGLGIGASSMIARSIGSKDFKSANTIFGTMTVSVLILSLFISLTARFFITSLLIELGASAATLPMAESYGAVILIGGPLLSYSIASNAIARAEGNAKMAMKTLIISATMNLILDPLLIYTLDLGISGAAWATVISQLCSATWMFFYFASGRSSLRLDLKNLRIKFDILMTILSIGSSAFVRQGASSFTATILNRLLLLYGGDYAVAAVGVLSKIVIFAYMPLFGLVQGMMPIVSHNLGAELKERVLKTINISIKGATVICATGAILLFSFPNQLLSFFCSEKALETAVTGAPYIAMSMPIVGFQVILSGTYQAMGRGGAASVLALMRTVFIKIPLLYLLTPMMGLHGVFWSFPVTEAITGSICLVLFQRMKKGLL